MSTYILKRHFYKNTYGEPFIVRIKFSVLVPVNCSLIADNLCRCDYWFAHDGNVKIKYDIIHDNNELRKTDEIIEKSIMVDLNTPFTENSKIDLIISNGYGTNEHYSSVVATLSNDPLSSKSLVK